MKYAAVRNYISGKFVESVSAETLDVLSPIDGSLLSKVPMSTSGELDSAVESAKKALPEWSAKPIKERVQVFFRYRSLLEKHSDELAALVHMSRRSFDRKFKASFGQSPKQWLLNARVEHAKTLLATTGHSIEQIATLCGFGTTQGLRDQFDLLVGISPARFRAQQLSNSERTVC